ncbi:hypothetical protein ACMAVT_17875 [Streptomyces sp. FW42]|uniref:hypothetical protein n=1 Tax=Streptomyces sp. FW42 TaxID=3395371 RepID=UPI003A858145
MDQVDKVDTVPFGAAFVRACAWRVGRPGSALSGELEIVVFEAGAGAVAASVRAGVRWVGFGSALPGGPGIAVFQAAAGVVGHLRAGRCPVGGLIRSRLPGVLGTAVFHAGAGAVGRPGVRVGRPGGRARPEPHRCA